MPSHSRSKILYTNINPEMDFKWFFGRTSHIFQLRDFEFKEWLVASIYSETTDNMEYLLNNHFKLPLDAPFCRLALKEITDVGSIIHFKKLVENYFPKDYKDWSMSSTIDQYIPSFSYKLFTKRHFDLLCQFLTYFPKLKEHPLYSLASILSYETPESIHLISAYLKKSGSRPYINYGWLDKTPTPNILCLLDLNLIKTTSLITECSIVIQDVTLFRHLLPQIKQSKCQDVINSSSLEIIKLAIEEGNQVVNDSKLLNKCPFNNNLEILRYLHDVHLKSPEKVKFSGNLLSKVLGFGGSKEIIDYIASNHIVEFNNVHTETNDFSSLFIRILDTGNINALEYIASVNESYILDNLKSTFHLGLCKCIEYLFKKYPEVIVKRLFQVFELLPNQFIDLLDYVLQLPLELLLPLKFHKQTFLDYAIRYNNIKLITLLVSHRTHPLLKRQMRVSKCSTVIDQLTKSNQIKMSLTLFKHGIFHFKHLKYFLHSSISQNNINIIEKIRFYFINHNDKSLQSHKKFNYFSKKTLLLVENKYIY
ncbi:hypothetical protein DLAC_01450 [Tieghemostelium lacteum]|uniref:Ankyrin repeat-containing protein n=1 Tax=Tieghemostelium lacteum TaxID=361077 RepID=A0A152A5G5_TIELA|nr:hypothetical protein DLAC_01450 [Tieghemostelium lacteum]|eukprot:KYR01468.1 hypothetical protein DLAC_01450 [Tieghemostelium lacteum]